MLDLPWDFTVLGVPVSVNAKKSSIRRWQRKVQAAAQAAWPSGDSPLSCKAQIHITFYHDSAPLDVDNMLKPILDALCGIAYLDDDQLTDTHGHLRDINDQFRVKGMTPAQALGFVAGTSFVHIRLEMPPVAGELP